MTAQIERFVTAQREVYADALAELRRGRKQSHWIWFVFPQLAGLGHSAKAHYYGIADAAEARTYLDHPLLERRLIESIDAVMAHAGAISAEAMLGPVDAMKLRSSMTLFDAVADEGDTRFARLLDAFYDGARDAATLDLLAH